MVNGRLRGLSSRSSPRLSVDSGAGVFVFVHHRPRLYFQVIAQASCAIISTMTNHEAPLPDRWSQLGMWITERRAKVKDAAVNVRRASWVVWEAHPPSALAMAGCTLVGSLLPASQAWVGKLIVDRGVKAINTQAGSETGL